MYDDDDEQGLDAAFETFNTYEDYLDSLIESEDLFFLEDVELARQLISVSQHGKGEVLTKDQFMERKQRYQKLKRDK